jgi:hypothetical protein
MTDEVISPLRRRMIQDMTIARTHRERPQGQVSPNDEHR